MELLQSEPSFFLKKLPADKERIDKTNSLSQQNLNLKRRGKKK
jgi:hypothetical protein